jgi:PGF-CTERM protein
MDPRASLVAVALTAALLVGPVGVVTAQGEETTTLTVAIVDTDDEPVGDATLDVTWDGGSTTATTAGNGKAFVDVPAGAEVRIAVTHPRYVRADPYVVESATERDVSVRVYRKSSIRLAVSDADGAVANASVRVERGGLTVATGTTDRSGVFESGVLREGNYVVTVTKPGYYDRRKPLEVAGNVTNRVSLRRGSVDVSVVVADPYFDPPAAVDDASVELVGVGTDRTDGEGETTVTAPVNTRPTLRVTKAGYRTVEREVAVGAENATVSVDLSRTPALTLSAVNERVVAGDRTVVTVTNAYGDDVAGATVTLDGERVATTDDEGEAGVRIDDPGEHTLRANTDGLASNEVGIAAIDPDAGAGGTATDAATPTATTTGTGTATGTETGAGGPGFTPALAVLSLLAAGLLAGRR